MLLIAQITIILGSEPMKIKRQFQTGYIIVKAAGYLGNYAAAILVLGLTCNMTRYFTSGDSIVTSRRRVEIQSTSEMSPYFTMTKCNKLFITYLTRSTERLPSLPSSI